MRPKMTAKLCAASLVAGAVLTPPTVRAAKKQAARAARRSARGYIKLRGKAMQMAEATGKPGDVAAMAAAFAASAARDAVDKWRELVVEEERAAEKPATTVPRPGAAKNEPVTTINDYLGVPS